MRIRMRPTDESVVGTWPLEADEAPARAGIPVQCQDKLHLVRYGIDGRIEIGNDQLQFRLSLLQCPECFLNFPGCGECGDFVDVGRQLIDQPCDLTLREILSPGERAEADDPRQRDFSNPQMFPYRFLARVVLY